MWWADPSCSERKQPEVVEDKDNSRDCIHTVVLVTAGTAVLIAACLRRAVVLFLVEQWRVWVFLALNLVVVAIFFTWERADSGAEQKKVKKEEGVEVEEEIEEEIEEEEEEEEVVELSKEELNERAEAFIVMFKQQLISDAKKGHIALSYAL